MKSWDWFRDTVLGAPRTTPSDPGAGRFVVAPRRPGGIFVNEDVALTYSAVWACVRIISETVATLPWHVFERGPDGDKKRMDGSALDRLLSIAPNPEVSALVFVETILAHALTWGNGYAEIERDRGGRPIGLWLIPPDRVEPKRETNGDLVYAITNGLNVEVTIPARDMFHLHGLGFDGLKGYSIISLAAKSIGLGLTTEQFGLSFFGNNTHTGGMLFHPKKLSAEALENLKDTIKDRSGPNNAHRWLVFEEGMTFESQGIPPENAQFLETRKFQISEIARWYRVPPHKIADLDRATFSNIEQQSMEFVQDTVRPWARRLEIEANIKLLGGSPRSFSKINLNSLLRGDLRTRAQFYKDLFNMAVFSPNDIRDLEDMNRVEGGDQRFVMANMITLENAGILMIAPPAREAQASAMRDIADRLLRREEKKILREAQKIDNRDRFIDVMRNFYYDQISVVVDAFTTPMLAFIAVLSGGNHAGGDIDTIVRLYAAEHVEESLRAAIAHFDGHAKNVFDESRADIIAEQLIDQAISLSMMRRKTNDHV